MSAYLSPLCPELNDVWINHLPVFLLPDRWLISALYRIVLDVMVVRWRNRLLLRNHIQSRVRYHTDQTIHIYVWTVYGCVVSEYVIQPHMHSIHQTRHYVATLSNRRATCAICGSFTRNVVRCRTVETNHTFVVCQDSMCEWATLKHGVLCRQQDGRPIYSEVVAIDS
jgi:hypothetical protein